MSCAFALHFQIVMKNGLFIVLMTVLIDVCSYGLIHMMVTLLPFNATNRK